MLENVAVAEDLSGAAAHAGRSFTPIARGRTGARARTARGRASGPTTDDPDRALVERWKAGDESAFEAIVQRHHKRIYRLLLRMMGSPEEAEDVTQETFLSLYRHGRSFRNESLFSTFVYRVAANAALNRRRTLGRMRVRLQKLAEQQAAGDGLPVEPRDPEQTTEGGELGGIVHLALARLTDAQRLPIVLYDIEGRSYGEIAKILGVAEGTVKSRIHRARQALRDELRALLPDVDELVRR